MIRSVDGPTVLDSLLLSERFVSTADRAKAASKGHALHVDGPGGGRDIFPIESPEDAKNAVTLWLSGHHKTAAAKAHIIKNARRVGATDQVARIQGQDSGS